MSKSELFYEEGSKTARPHKYSINYKDKNDSVYAIKFYSMQKQIDEKDKEIEQLENTIHEIEKYTHERIKLYKKRLKFPFYHPMRTLHNIWLYEKYLSKLKKLKGGKNDKEF